MTFLRLEDLPPKMRQQAEQQIARQDAALDRRRKAAADELTDRVDGIAAKAKARARAKPAIVPAPDPIRRCAHPDCPGPCTSPQTYRLELPGRAPTTNRYIRALFLADPAHQRAVTAEVAGEYLAWKQAAWALGLGIPTLARAAITVQAHYRSGKLPDAGGLTIAGKAVVDGLVEAGVFVDDDGSRVTEERYVAPVRTTGNDHVLVTIDANG